MDIDLGGVFVLMYVGIIAIFISIVVGAYTIVDYFFIEDYVTIEQPWNPVEVTIIDNGNGVDTLYTYKVKQ